jgi:hypothetical protein
MINNFKQKLKSFETQRKTFKKEFEKIIKNKKIPLADRWLLWEDAPDALKEHDTFIHRGDNTKGGQAFNEWREGFDDMRGGFDVASMISDDAYHVAHPDEVDEYEDEREQDVELIMEYILKANIGSFEWDW